MDEHFYSKGLEIRRDVVGQARVELAIGQADDFTRPLQELTTSFAWGQVWGREHLDRRTRSLLTIAMLIALGRQAELEVHINGGLNNGLTEIDIQEIIIHSAVYCGFPAALQASSAAKSVLHARVVAEKR
ncbi:carboxymuconolactone decarboxylase family protein [Agrobacterium fabacearum]|uniref:carboxymuconolactone decarboxylase family protein n=1 Tax=Agrobacterium tumefaciens TaxID=358 RepID=UPI002852FEDB|nr:carboxymuconolactone decarboxylase family protein [Agrobacterium tumefaciens]MDR5012549.1 carboxymuconolactone decarboxylase family protein [Agrobacterium tumefaciens]